MKIVIIGASGHGGLCVPKIMCEERNFVAIAPGSKGENVDGMVRTLHMKEYTPAIYSDYREMLRKEKPDVAIVDNFYGEHAPIILDAFEAGCHVLAEKPVAATMEQLEQLREAWDKAGTAFSTMFTYRYNGAFYRAWNLIQEGAVGKVRLLNAQKSYKYGTRPDFMTRRETYGGTIPWVGIHGVDWILWMSGGRFESVTAVQSAAQAPNGISPETTALTQFRLNDKMMASLTVDYLNPATAPGHGDDRIRVVGTEGVLEVRDNRVTLINGDGVQYPENLPDEDMFADFLRHAAGKGPCRISGEEVFTVTRAALLAQSAADSGEIICFDR